MYTEKNRKIYQKLFDKTILYLKGKEKILFLSTSNRWAGEADGELPKSMQLAHAIADIVGRDRVEIIDITKLKIYSCEGNISTAGGNSCGIAQALLKDPEKNPSSCHRCWVSINKPDDELWRVSKALLNSSCVVFFTSIRWGQTNSEYQKLIERLTWLENRHSTLGESNILEKIESGIIAIGHNWRGHDVVGVQKKVLSYFGFRVADALCWNWRYTDADDESNESYKDSVQEFKRTFFE